VWLSEKDEPMSPNRLPDTIPDTTPLYRLIARVRALLRSTWVLTGLGLTVGLLLGTLVAVTVTDLVVPLLPALRLTGLLLIATPAAWAFLVGVVRPLCRRLGPTQVARRIETHLPGIHNRLVSSIDLAEGKEEKTTSLAFYRRLLSEALQRIQGFRTRSVVDFQSLRRAGAFSFGSILAFVAALLLFSDRMPRAMARIFQPFADLPPKTGVDYTVEPGTAKVLRGDDIPFTVNVEKGNPRNMRLELRNENAPAFRISLPFSDKSADAAPDTLWYELQKQKDGKWQVVLNSSAIGTGFENSFRYRVHGGGTWSPEYQIQIVERPKITDLHTLLHFPQYMGINEPRVGLPQTAEVTGPEGSNVEVVVRVEGNVTEGEIQHLELRKHDIPVKEQKERTWFEDKVPAGAAADGRWVWDPKTHQQPTHTEPPAVGTHSHWFQNASVGFQIQPGEDLFAYVYIVPEHPPETIMLKWHDGSNWEHRAYWGLDMIKEGKADSASRRRVGPMPAAGEWVRLSVPAELLELDGKVIRGMSFTLSGGQCFWGRSGAVQVVDQVLQPYATFAMHASGDDEWSGTFPLKGTGLYRVELRNELGHANKTMKEAKFIAIADNPPQIVLERPGTDVVLSTPGKLPLQIAAYDDFGLADVILMVQRGDQGAWERRVVKQYRKPQRSDNILTSLDLVAMELKVGDFLRYRAEARDRKGQYAKTQDYVVRIAVDQNAADQQLAAFDKSQDPFRKKLVDLIGEQTKIRDTVEKVAAKNSTLNEKVKAAVAEAKAKAAETAKDNPAQAQADAAPPKLDPDSEKALQELRKELAELAKHEAQNVQLGKQIADDLARTVDQAKKLQMLPREIAKQLDELQKQFQQLGIQPLEALANRMDKGSDAKNAPPDLKQLNKESDRVLEDLKAMQERMKALDEAQRQLKDNPDEAIAKLQRDMAEEKGGLTARDLQDLKDFIAALRKDLKNQEGKQENLMDVTLQAPEEKLSDVEKQQGRLDKGSEELLNEAKDLLKADKAKRMKNKRKPDFPDEPYAAEGEEKKVRPMEEDPDDPDAKKDKDKADAKGDKADAKDKKDDKDDEDEDQFMPALGGKEQVDPRFANKMRPVDKKGQKGDKSARRDNLERHQGQQMQNLDRAQRSLASDEQSLAEMLDQLRQNMRNQSAQQGQPHQGQPHDGPQSLSQKLAEMMQSPAMQQAMAMAQRMRGMRQGMQAKGKIPQNPQATNAPIGNLQGSSPADAALEGELGKLDLNTRAALLRMQPQLREELLQSMREEGPEGYRKFIQDYFKRLTEVKPTK
jgi:hypothetical protein